MLEAVSSPDLPDPKLVTKFNTLLVLSFERAVDKGTIWTVNGTLGIEDPS